MGNYKVTSKNPKVKSSATIKTNKIYVDGWWADSTHKGITKSTLSNDVIFKINIWPIDENAKVKLHLRTSYSSLPFCTTVVKKFGKKGKEEEIVREVTMKNGSGEIYLELSEEWADTRSSIGRNPFHLYWDVEIDNKIYDAPAHYKDHLVVGPSDNYLYIKPMAFCGYFPEIFSNDGEMCLLSNLIDITIDLADDKIGELVGKAIEKKIPNIAITKLGKGQIAKSMGEIRQVGDSFEMSYPDNNWERQSLIQGDSKDKYGKVNFINNQGSKAKILGVCADIAKNAGYILDFVSLLKFAQGDKKDLPRGLLLPALGGTAFVPLVGALSLPLNDFKAEYEEFERNQAYKELNEAKSKGYKEVEKLIRREDLKNAGYKMVTVDEKILCRMLDREFKEIREIENLSYEEIENPIHLLYRKISFPDRLNDGAVIETFFTNI